MKALAALRRFLGVAGIVLLAVALAYAPVAAFHDDMTAVSKAGIAGALLVLIAWLLPAPRGPSTNHEADRPSNHEADRPSDDDAPR